MLRRAATVVAMLAAVFFCPAVQASEAITYTYDALGRLQQMTTSGTVNSGLQTVISYDPAGNRASYAMSGATVSLSVAGASVTEGGNLVFTVTRSGTPTGTITVNYATANGTATAGSDYTATSGTLTFLTTDTSKTITVPTTDDVAVEGNETLTVTLSGPSAGVTLGTATATGTIVDNDFAPVSFAVGNAAAVTEGNPLVFTVTKTGTTSASLNVNYATANGTATAGSDYTATSGTLTFAPADTSKPVSVATINDATAESAETVLLNISGATGGATITTSQGSGTVNDNDTTPITFAIANALAVTEGGTLIYTVTKSGATSATTSVNYATANGTATAGSDYTATSGTLTFGPADTSKTINVATIDDSVSESAETVLVNLTSPVGGTITTAQGSGTINDNDAVNHPPVANPDRGNVARCGEGTFNVVANDTDPDGDYPLTVVSVTGTPTFTVASSTSLRYSNANTTAGNKVGTYVVQDSRGAQSSGTLTITVPTGVCQ